MLYCAPTNRVVLRTGVLALAWLGGAASPVAATTYQPRTVHDVDLLPNGRLLVPDGGVNNLPGTSGIYEIDRNGSIVWSYTAGLNFAHNADQQADGSVIISDSSNDRVIIVNAAGSIVWNSDNVPLSDGSQLYYPNDANLLPNGNILITDRNNHRALEITTAGTKVWQFGQTGVPGGGATRLNKATHTTYGGFGACLWTRCNSATGYTNNLPNAVYSMADQPEYLAESVNAGQVQREYLVALANMSRLSSDGDLNCDGTADFDDIGAFVLALGGQDGYEASYATCDWRKADCNADSNVDFDDISALVALLGQ